MFILQLSHVNSTFGERPLAHPQAMWVAFGCKRIVSGFVLGNSEVSPTSGSLKPYEVEAGHLLIVKRLSNKMSVGLAPNNKCFKKRLLIQDKHIYDIIINIRMASMNGLLTRIHFAGSTLALGAFGAPAGSSALLQDSADRRARTAELYS